MKFQSNTVITQILDALFKVYSERVPDVLKITKEMVSKGIVSSQNDIVNDHIAFRTMGVPNLGIGSFEKIFLAHGYIRRDFYHFKQKKIDAFWYESPSSELPRIFISELKVETFSKKIQKLIKSYTNSVTTDPIDDLDLEDPKQVINYLLNPLWKLPSINDYELLLEESEYAAWVIYNRYYLNHYTISVHNLPQPYNQLESFNSFLVDIGIKLNTSGGVIKTSADNGMCLNTSDMGDRVVDAICELPC